MQHHAALPQQTWATEEHSRLPSSSDPRVFNPTSSSSFVSEGVDDPELAAQQRNGALSQDDEGGYTAKGLVNSTERGLQHTTPEGRRQQMKDIFSPDSRTAADDVRIGGSSSNDSSPQAAARIFSSSAAAAAAVSSQTEEGHEEYSNAAAFLSPQRGTIGSSAVASNSNEDFFFSRDPLLLPRRNHTIGAGTTPNRKRIDSHFMFPSQGPTSPGQNSLSAITGGKDVDDDEWEAMIKSRRSLVPGEDDREDTSHHNSDRSDEAAPWQRNTSLAHAQHRRFPSQPSSVRAVSPFLSGAHSPVASRQTRGGADLHKRSESASIRSLEQGPFASASTYVPSSSEGLFANLDPSMIRRHQSLNHATGRAMASRLQGSSRKNLYANRPHDSERTSPVASLAFDANSSRVSPGPGYDRGEMSTAAHLSPEAVGLSPSHSPASTLLSTSLLDAHARLSRMSIHPSHKDASDAGSAATTGRGQQLHSLVTNRDALETAALYSSPGKRDVQGPASAAAYVPPIGHAHFRQQESSPSYGSMSTGTEGDVHSRSDPVRGTALQGPFSALPTSMPWPHQGPSTVGKPSTMVTSQLETAREESPMMDNNGFDGSQNRTIDAAGADRAGKQASLDSMAMNIAVLQQRLLSQQQQLQQPHRSSPHSVPHLLQQPQQQYLHHPHQLSTHAGMQQQQQQQQQQQHPAMLYGATQPGMMDMRHSPQLTSYNPMFLDNSGLRAHQPHFSHINNLPSNSRPVHPQQHAPKAYAMPPSSSQPTVPVSTTISPALAALIVEKGYNPSPAQFDITAPRARFFVIKSFTEDDVQRSLKHEIWASTEKGNQRLDRAFKECEAEGYTPLYLFYSVNASGHFCGMAQMMSALDYNSTSNVWVQEGKWKGTFRVKWIFVKDVPNVKLRHIKLTNTVERKAVTQSRDTQELPTEGGKEVLRIMAEYQMKTTLLQDWLFYEQSASLHHQQRNDGPPPPPPSLPASQ